MFIGAVFVMHSSFVTKNLITAFMPSVVNTRLFPLMKGFPDKRSRGRVMSTNSSANLKEELFPLVYRDALHEYSRRTPFVKFIADCDKSLCASSDSTCFSPFQWENLLDEVGE